MYDDLVRAAAARHNVPENIIRAVIQHESGGNADAVGDGGLARGLMQMHPAAAATVGADYGGLFDPGQAIDAGTAYLAFLFTHFGTWEWALAAYNQGPTVIGRAWTYQQTVTKISTRI